MKNNKVNAIIQQNKNALRTNRTRRLNPKLGFLGFFGFLGFLDFDLPGFWIRFIFFGFFGFFYEGKMSDTLMDERFKENKFKAQLMALKTAFAGIIIALILFSLGEYFRVMSTENLLRMEHSLIALSIALAIFLSEYLLYRYDHDEYNNDEHINSEYGDNEYDKSGYYSEYDKSGYYSEYDKSGYYSEYNKSEYDKSEHYNEDDMKE